MIVLDAVQAQTAQFQAEHPGVVVADNLEVFYDVEVVVTMLPNSDIVDAIILGQAGRTF